MKKLVALLLCAAMVFGLAACGGSASATEETAAKEAATEAAATEAAAAETAGEAEKAAPAEAAEEASGEKKFDGVTITYWMAPHGGLEEDMWNDHIAEEFESKTGIHVDTTFVPWDQVSTKYLSGFMSGEGPDVFFCYNDLMYDLISNGYIKDLDYLFTQEEKDDQIYWNLGNMLGGQYGIPYNGALDARGMVFNMDILKAAGVEEVPKTREEVIEAGLKIKEAGICEYPVMYQAGTQQHAYDSFIMTLMSGGGDIINSEGTAATVNTQEAVDALQFIHDLVYKYELVSKDALSLTTENTRDLFLEGKVGMCAMQGGQCTSDSFTPDFDWYFTCGVNDGAHATMTINPFDVVCMNSGTSNEEAAGEFIKYLTSVEHRKWMRENSRSAHIQMNVNDSYEVPHTENMAPIEEMNEQTCAVPVCKGYAAMVNAIGENLQLLMMDEISAEEASEAMQNACTEALEE